MSEPQTFNIAAKAILRSGGKAFVFKCRVQNYSGEMVDIWSLPGGKLDVGETEIDAMRRELKEEIGYDVDLKVAEIKFGGYYIDLDIQPGKKPICFLHMIVDLPEEFTPEQTDDFIEYQWLDWEEFVELPLHLKGIKMEDILHEKDL